MCYRMNLKYMMGSRVQEEECDDLDTRVLPAALAPPVGDSVEKCGARGPKDGDSFAHTRINLRSMIFSPSNYS